MHSDKRTTLCIILPLLNWHGADESPQTHPFTKTAYLSYFASLSTKSDYLCWLEWSEEGFFVLKTKKILSGAF